MMKVNEHCQNATTLPQQQANRIKQRKPGGRTLFIGLVNLVGVLCLVSFMGKVVFATPLQDSTFYLPIIIVQNAATATPTSTPIAGPTATPTSVATTPPGDCSVYTQSGGNVTQDQKTYCTSAADTSAVLVENAGKFTLTNANISTSGNTTSNENSSFYGQNAAVLAKTGSTIGLSNSAITTTGTGANGAYAYGTGSTVSLTNVTINAKADGAHGVMATNGGQANLSNVNIGTAGPHSSAIATDRGGGTIIVTGGTVTVAGQDSADLYSTGDISVTDATLTSTGAEAAVIEGANKITLLNTKLTSTKAKWGVMLFQSFSGDAQGQHGIFRMTGGALAYTPASGPLFYVTNTTGEIHLNDVTITLNAPVLLDASAGNWGNSGSNGGNAIVTADTQTLVGNVTADNLSTIQATLQNNSTLTGAINTANTAKTVNLTLDATSAWTVTADSHLTCLTDSASISGDAITNITGGGHTITYSASACTALGGKTYSLQGGGSLQPAN